MNLAQGQILRRIPFVYMSSHGRKQGGVQWGPNPPSPRKIFYTEFFWKNNFSFKNFSEALLS